MNPVKLWLITCSILLIILIWVGGITRLTNSGLSITEWKPVTGIIPPLTENEWLQEELKYKKTPEYEKINFDISLGDFKKIYLIEYMHRLFARLIGLVFILPFIYFLVRKKLKKKTEILLLVVLSIGVLQGFMGWYMVQSGLINEPHVSQYRLVSHLLLATIIFCLLLWASFYTNKDQLIITKYEKCILLSTILLTILQIAIGGIMAGLKAGLAYNTFPLMDKQLVPDGLFIIHPWWKNIFENVTTVQFFHRLIGVIILLHAMIIYFFRRNKFSFSILTVITFQVIIGVLTLLYHIPIIIASLHQMIAFIILTMSIFYYRKY